MNKVASNVLTHCFAPGDTIARLLRRENATHSERDWAWVLRELGQGTDPAKLTRTLALRRSDKPDPFYYAQRTVDVASAKLWLIDGVPTDDIITMLQFRRSLELPAARCSAHAREITQTAERMIARRRIA